LKLVIFSDIQFNEWKEFSRILPDGLNSRFNDQLQVLDEVFQFSIKNKADILIHTGDLFETLTERISKKVFLEVYDKFAEFSKNGIVTILLVGNHDWLDKTESDHLLAPFSEISNVVIVDKERVELAGDIALCFIPNTKQDFNRKVYQITKQLSGARLKYLFSHQGVSGVKTGPRDVPLKEDYSIADFKPAYFDLIFNGHYHKPQRMGSNLVIVGSPLQKDFGEREDGKGFLFLDTEKEPRKPIYVETHGPKFYKVEVNGKEELNLPKGFSSTDFLWVVSNNSAIYDLPLLKELGDRVRIDVQTERVATLRTDISINMSIEEQIRRYVGQSIENWKQFDLDKEKLTDMGIEKYRRSV